MSLKHVYTLTKYIYYKNIKKQENWHLNVKIKKVRFTYKKW